MNNLVVQNLNDSLVGRNYVIKSPLNHRGHHIGWQLALDLAHVSNHMYVVLTTCIQSHDSCTSLHFACCIRSTAWLYSHCDLVCWEHNLVVHTTCILSIVGWLGIRGAYVNSYIRREGENKVITLLHVNDYSRHFDSKNKVRDLK